MNSYALVDAWEDGCRRSRVERPLVLLTAAQPGTSEQDWAGLPVGERDARLLRLHDELFGTRLNASAVCPKCGERLDVSLSTDDIRVPTSGDPTKHVHVTKSGKYVVSFRLPTTADLSVVAQSGPGLDPKSVLLERCIVEASKAGVATNVDKLPAAS